MKKSCSALSALSASIKPCPIRFGGFLDLSDDEDEIWFTPPPKKAKSHLGPMTEEEHKFFQIKEANVAPLSQQQTENESGMASSFPEMTGHGVHSPDSVLPEELQKDIENAREYLYQPSKPELEDYCSSSSEFEVDDDSSEDWDEFPAAPKPYLSLNSSVLTDSITDTCSSTLAPTPSSSLTMTPTNSSSSRTSIPISSTTAPLRQSAITNYFGSQTVDGGISKPAKAFLPNSSVFGKKRASPTPASSKAAPKAISVSTTKYGDEEEEIEKTWHRDPTVKDSCPFYKRIAGTTFIVDDFRFIYKTPNTKSFFLSHFHSDHYQGLNSKFNRGIVYCSPITAALVQTVLRVPSKFIQIVPLRTTVVVEDVEVTFFDANHCPGAVVLLFRLRDGSLHLHTGDFRFDADLPDHIHLLSLQTTVANLYLDTTYADSRYTFPHQQLVISKVLELVAPHVKEPKTLIVVGTYTIGKERMFLALAERFGLKFYVKSSKLRILKCLDMELILREMASADMMEARIHVIPIFDISLKKLEAFLDSQSYWTRIVAIRPTGWAYSSPKKSSRASASIPSIDNYLTGSKTPKKTNLEQPSGFSTHSSRKGSIIIHSVPYSEHSSFSELCTVVRTLKPRWIIPTVNNRSREAVAEMVRNLRG